jgi:DNA invertase Pin-like site-specific DNA recombinase
MSKLYIYTSPNIQVSLEDQRHNGIEKANELGMEYEVFEEEGEGYPQLSRLLELCEQGEMKYVYVTDYDLLTQDQDYYKETIEPSFKKRNVILYY